MLFRESCTALRKKIFKYAKELPNEKRVLNLEKWVEEAIMTWRALKDSDDFAKIKNLGHIRDHRKLVHALHKYEDLVTNHEDMFPKKRVNEHNKKMKAVIEHNKKYDDQKKTGADMSNQKR